MAAAACYVVRWMWRFMLTIFSQDQRLLTCRLLSRIFRFCARTVILRNRTFMPKTIVRKPLAKTLILNCWPKHESGYRYD